MKYIINIKIISLLCSALVFTQCDDDNEHPIVPLESTQVADLNSESTRNFTLFSFADNQIILNSDSATSKWDIGFRGTTLILNGGISGPGQTEGQIVSGIFDELTEAPASGYSVDNATAKAIVGSGGWYNYTGTTSVPNHAILPIAGKIIVVKTSDGKYAKVEIISYYRGNPDTTTAAFADLATRPAARFYTFRFIFQPDGTTNFETTK
jgi:hypothetical protein